ncbi:MAG: hypothetical protein WC613_01090 [Candidatus Aenigmatarchaeota archaeon]
MNYSLMIGFGAAGLVLTKLAGDTYGGYVFTTRLLRDGLSQREIEQRVSECMPSDMKYASKIGRELAYFQNRKASRNQGRRSGVEQL